MAEAINSTRLNRLLRVEILIVLALSLGKSAIYSVLALLNELTIPAQPLSNHVTKMNTAVVPDRPWLDLLYQLANIAFPLAPAILALYLLSVFHPPTGGVFSFIGFNTARPRFDLGWGVAAFLTIGIPGLGLYLLSRSLGINTIVQPANLTNTWWTIPILVGAATMNALLEELIMLGYLCTRWVQCSGHGWVIVLISALIRGSYHLYQGFGGGIGNFIMGLLFGWLYLKFHRIGPLVVAHFLLDLFAFVGYSLLAPYLSY